MSAERERETHPLSQVLPTRTETGSPVLPVSTGLTSVREGEGRRDEERRGDRQSAPRGTVPPRDSLHLVGQTACTSWTETIPPHGTYCTSWDRQSAPHGTRQSTSTCFRCFPGRISNFRDNSTTWDILHLVGQTVSTSWDKTVNTLWDREGYNIKITNIFI